MLFYLYVFEFLFIDLRDTDRQTSICCSTYLYIHKFLSVPWPGIKPSILACWDNAQTKLAGQDLRVTYSVWSAVPWLYFGWLTTLEATTGSTAGLSVRREAGLPQRKGSEVGGGGRYQLLRMKNQRGLEVIKWVWLLRRGRVQTIPSFLKSRITRKRATGGEKNVRKWWAPYRACWLGGFFEASK